MKTQKKWLISLCFLGLCAIGFWPAASRGASYQIYSNWASFNTSVGGQVATNNLDGYAAGTSLNNVELISGLKVTSNMANVFAWTYHPDIVLFGYDDTTRLQGIAYYDILLSLPYHGVAFNIDLWNPAAPGPAVADIYFGDASHISLNFYQTGPTESTPVFFGITADTSITSIRWHEGPEVGGSGNEEVALDNFAVSPVPEPCTLLLFGLGAAMFRTKAHRF
jgi:hypothetical protein